MNIPQFMKYLEERKANPPVVGECSYCHEKVYEHQSSIDVPAGLLHKDCCWNIFGDLVEKHPICSPGRKGIGGSNLHESDLEEIEEK